jgi:hypothetical protein
MESIDIDMEGDHMSERGMDAAFRIMEHISAEKIERVRVVLEKAAALHKENPEKGEVYIVVKDTRKDMEWATQTKIAEIVDGDAVSPDGDRISLRCIDEVELVDEA